MKADEQTAQSSHEENEDAELKEQLINMTHERDTYKKKLEEFQTHLEEAKVCINFSVIWNTLIVFFYVMSKLGWGGVST